MKKYVLSGMLLCLFGMLVGCQPKGSEQEQQVEASQEVNAQDSVGLLIIDAQKWFIPGHKESLYKKWNVPIGNRTAAGLIGNMDTVLAWANAKDLPVVVTYEGLDTGAYDLPIELKQHLPENAFHYVKTYYAALKHEDFRDSVMSKPVNRWVVIGAETDVCVYQTVKSLLEAGKEVSLVTEAVYSGKIAPKTSWKNMVAFGADTISVEQLYQGKFTNERAEELLPLEEPLSIEDLVLTVVVKDSSAWDTTSRVYQRFEYIKTYAQVVGIPQETLVWGEHEPMALDSSKSRLLVGQVDEAVCEKLGTETPAGIRVVVDCVQDAGALPKDVSTNTLKMVFYDLMETAAWYGKDESELTGFLKDLKRAYKDGTLGYVESLQND